MSFDAPVLLLLWRRPDATRLLIEALRVVAPTRLFIACDGPGSQDHAAVARTRQMVESLIDWPCIVQRQYRANNLGCRDGVSSALDWFFSKVDAGIILEDDCIPHPDFFRFCGEMLQRYAPDDRVWVVTGDNFQRGRTRGTGTYYYSRYPHCWGWATWRRAWRHFDASLAFWPSWRHSSTWLEHMPDRIERAYWSDIFERVYQGELRTSWAYPWTACVWHGGGLTITPNANLVTNIGFDQGSTHTSAADRHLAPPATALGPIRHPEAMRVDFDADRFVFDHHFGGRNRRFPRALFSWPRSIAGRLARAAGLVG